jgi:hypothetical protein
MLKNKLIGIIALGSSMVIFGLLVIFNSGKLGLDRTDNWLFERGSADNTTYLFIMENYSNSYLIVGSILFGIGLATIVGAFYKILTSNESNVSTSATTIEE